MLDEAVCTNPANDKIPQRPLALPVLARMNKRRHLLYSFSELSIPFLTYMYLYLYTTSNSICSRPPSSESTSDDQLAGPAVQFTHILATFHSMSLLQGTNKHCQRATISDTT